MQTKHYLIEGVAFVCIALVLSCHGQKDEPKIVTTTSVLSSVAEDIARDKIKVATLVPAGSCPGHFDVKVQHLRSIEKSGILLAHGFEEYLPSIKGAVSNPSFEPVVIQIETGWLSLQGIRSLYQQTAKHLKELFPEHKTHFDRQLERALAKTAETHMELKNIVERLDLAGVKVICNSHIEGYLEYLGLDVVGTYGRQEDLSPEDVLFLIGTGKDMDVELIVDNMQAGPDTGRVFSEELDIPHVAVSNFPGVLPSADTLYETLLVNTDLIKTKWKVVRGDD